MTAPTYISALLCGALGAYAAALFGALLRPSWSRPLLLLGVLAHLLATVARGIAIDFFPLTGKMESFSTAALALALVLSLAFWPRRCYLAPLLTLIIAALGAALWLFDTDLRYPPPLMQTLWYPLHVPLSFICYALWLCAAAAGWAYFASAERVWLRRLDRLCLWGFGLFTLSMITGGLWGAVAWGAYFLWDPKVIWSVILWFHYASYVHLKLTPALVNRPWVRPVLAQVGALWVIVAYVGTSFFFGRSSHAF